MISFLLKNRFFLILLSTLCALLLGNISSQAAAAATQTATVILAGAAMNHDNARSPLAADLFPPPGPPPSGPSQINNQSFHGVNGNRNVTTLVGTNQGNSGNQGLNRGYSQDNSVNSGNQVSGQRKIIQLQENNQYLQQSDDQGSNNTNTQIGSNQGNSGNEGLNFGHNQDNSSNTGNQVNNEGNVIGTQINKQGTTVNNQGDLIEHQTNYLYLLPNVGIEFTLKPRLQIGLSVGRN